jgi:hypothetical protein
VGVFASPDGARRASGSAGPADPPT